MMQFPTCMDYEKVEDIPLWHHKSLFIIVYKQFAIPSLTYLISSQKGGYYRMWLVLVAQLFLIMRTMQLLWTHVYNCLVYCSGRIKNWYIVLNTLDLDMTHGLYVSLPPHYPCHSILWGVPCGCNEEVEIHQRRRGVANKLYRLGIHFKGLITAVNNCFSLHLYFPRHYKFPRTWFDLDQILVRYCAYSWELACWSLWNRWMKSFVSPKWPYRCTYRTKQFPHFLFFIRW